MTTLVRALGHLLRGRTSLWQCYTTISWRTCDRCLSWHGRIVADREVSSSHDGCSRELRPFPVWRLRVYQELGRRMARRARDELRRREAFGKAVAKLATDPEASLSLLDQAAAVDVHLPEIETLAQHPALADPGLRARLREIHLARWKSKFASARYERQPELARAQQEEWGVQRIKELFR